MLNVVLLVEEAMILDQWCATPHNQFLSTTINAFGLEIGSRPDTGYRYSLKHP